MDQPPDAEIISRLGGPAAVGRLFDITSQAVSQWKRGGIPKTPRRYLQLLHPEAFEAAQGSEQQAAATEARDAA